MSRPGVRRLARLVDATLEASVAGSFSRVGFTVRAGLEHWGPPGSLVGRVVIVTGASSGIGRAVALETARLGATTWVLGRDRDRTETVARDARGLGAGGTIEPVVLDLVDPGAVHAFAERIATVHDHVDVLVHAAGALFPSYRCAPDGCELTSGHRRAGTLPADGSPRPAAPAIRRRQHRDRVVRRDVHGAI